MLLYVSLEILVWSLPALNVIMIRVQRHAKINKHRTLLDGVDVGPFIWRVCGLGLNRSVHEGMNDV